MEPLCSNIKKLEETKTPKNKILIFQETETLKKLLLFRETEPVSPSPKKLKKSNSEKNHYISGNVTF